MSVSLCIISRSASRSTSRTSPGTRTRQETRLLLPESWVAISMPRIKLLRDSGSVLIFVGGPILTVLLDRMFEAIERRRLVDEFMATAVGSFCFAAVGVDPIHDYTAVGQERKVGRDCTNFLCGSATQR